MPALPTPPFSAADDADGPKVEALEGLGGDEPRINGFRFLNAEGGKAAVAGTGGALITFLLAGGAERPPALEEEALSRTAAAAEADSFVRGGLTESRCARDFPIRPFVPAPLARIPPAAHTPEPP